MVEASSGTGGGVVRTRSLTEDDLEELKGCLDLGFGFAYSEIPELCGTLPALELCYSMTRRFLDEQRAPSKEQENAATPLPNWRISGPGKSFFFLSPQVSICQKKRTIEMLCIDSLSVLAVKSRGFQLFCVFLED